jgi:ferrous iron transport protein B
VGNPNTGKSVLFSELTRHFAEVSNYGGTTLLVSEARFGDSIVVDTPGVYGLRAGREEEEVRRAVEAADIVVDVLDATNLERGLWLTLELLETGKPTFVVLNMWDELEESGQVIDADRLRDLLGVPVFTTVAIKGIGVPELAKFLRTRLSTPLGGLSVDMSPPLLESSSEYMGLSDTLTWKEALARRERIETLLKEVLKAAERPPDLGRVLSELMIRPLTGVPLALGILSAVFYLIGTFVAQDLVGFTEGFIFQQLYEPVVRQAVGHFLSGPLYEILVGEFGVLTMTVTYVFGLLLPLVFAFYVMMAVLEDTGYLPRLATLADRTFSALGMNGKAVIPIVLGFGCVTMATITTRMLGRGKERTVAIALLALAVPCSAQAAVILVLLAGLGFLYWALYGGILLTVFLLIGLLLSHLVPGERSDLIYELPRLRLPQARNVLRKAWFRLWVFIKDVFPLFLLGALIISVLLVTGILGLLQEAMQPLVRDWLGLPPEAATALIMGFVRRDFGAAGFFHIQLTAVQAVVGMLVITLFVPCIASFMVIHRELGLKGVLGILAFTLTVAFLTGGIVYRILILLAGG